MEENEADALVKPVVEFLAALQKSFDAGQKFAQEALRAQSQAIGANREAINELVQVAKIQNARINALVELWKCRFPDDPVPPLPSDPPFGRLN